MIAVSYLYFGFQVRPFIGWLGIALGLLIIVLWFSRRAEYRADRFAVERLGSPEPVIAMLKGMQNGDGDGNDDESDGEGIDTGRANGSVAPLASCSTPIRCRPSESSRSSAMNVPEAAGTARAWESTRAERDA